MNENIVDKQRAQENVLVHQAQVLRETFSTVAGQEALVIIKELCGHERQLPGPQVRADDALYWGGRRDVYTAIQKLLSFTPRSDKPVVKTKA